MQISSSTSTAATTGQPYSQAKADLEKAAKAFEAIFMRQMIGAMRQASLDEGLSDSSASLQFRDMADARTADSLAETGGMGIAELLVKQLGAKLPKDQPAPVGDIGKNAA
jgi:flagellar protein FlgJ